MVIIYGFKEVRVPICRKPNTKLNISVKQIRIITLRIKCSCSFFGLSPTPITERGITYRYGRK